MSLSKYKWFRRLRGGFYREAYFSSLDEYLMMKIPESDYSYWDSYNFEGNQMAVEDYRNLTILQRMGFK